MQYRTATFQEHNRNRDTKINLPQVRATESIPSGPNFESRSENDVEGLSDNSNAFGEARTVDMSSKVPVQETITSQAGQGATWKLPWDEEELKHFRRVRIPEFDSQKRMSSASTLALVSAAVRSLVAKYSLTSSAGSIPQYPDLGVFMSDLINFSNQLFTVSNAAYIEVLTTQEAYIDIDWKIKRSSSARQRMEDLVLQSRTIFKEMMIFYHELSNHEESFNSIIKKTSSRRSFVLKQVDRSFQLYYLLNELSSIDAAWRHGGALTSREIQQSIITWDENGEPANATSGVATCLKITQKYIALALDNARIFVFDHDSNPLKTLIGHVEGVWAMEIHEDTLISGSSDRDLRIWDPSTGCVQPPISLVESPNFSFVPEHVATF